MRYELDERAARSFLVLLHGRFIGWRNRVYFKYPPYNGRQQWASAPCDLPHCAQLGIDIYVSIAVFSGGKRRNDTARWVPALWVDLDPKQRQPGVTEAQWRSDALRRLYAYQPVPTLIVDSGRGWHAYWVFTEPLCLPEDPVARGPVAGLVTTLNKALQADLGGDNVGDLARVMRLPGSINNRSGRRCAVINDTRVLYDVNALAGMLANRVSSPAPPKQSAAKPASQTHPAPVPTIKRGRGRPSRGVTLKHLRSLPDWARRAVIGGAWADPTRYSMSGSIDRSKADWAVVGAMVRAGWADERIWSAFQRPDWLIGARYQELARDHGHQRAAGYLGRTIAKIRS